MSGRTFAQTSRRRSVVVLVLAAVVLLLAACQPQAPAADAGGCVGPAAPPDATSLGIFNRVNSDRAANGLAPVSWNPQLWLPLPGLEQPDVGVG